MGGARECGGGQKRLEKGDEVDTREEIRGVDGAGREEEGQREPGRSGEERDNQTNVSRIQRSKNMK